MSIAEGIISIINSEKEKNGFDRVIEIALGIGEYSGIEPECLVDFFPYAARNTAAEGAKLVINKRRALFFCEDCKKTGLPDKKKYCCIECGSMRLKMVSGNDFFVESIKVE